MSRSGYYNWCTKQKRIALGEDVRELQDKSDFDFILKAYKFRGYDKGRRGIRMRLLHMGIVMNEKKIARLMKKYNLLCPIRKANPYRRMAKAIKTNNYTDNTLDRQFEEHGPGMVLLRDITYVYYGSKRRKAYLSVIKDAFTKQILSYVLSPSIELDFVLETVNQLFEKHKKDIKAEALIHSDQGCHYTSIRFIQLINDKELRQSMSRRGNCWDNAPQESFFGHMKDECDIAGCQTYEDLRIAIDDYMDYYNTDRYQYRLAKLSPNEYLKYYNTGKYPLKGLINEPVTKEPTKYAQKKKHG